MIVIFKTGTVRRATNMDKHFMNRWFPALAGQECPQPTIPERRVSLDQGPHSGHRHCIRGLAGVVGAARLSPSRTQGRSRHLEHGTEPALGGVQEDARYSPDVFGSKGWPFMASLRMSRSRTSSPTFA